MYFICNMYINSSFLVNKHYCLSTVTRLAQDIDVPIFLFANYVYIVMISVFSGSTFIYLLNIHAGIFKKQTKDFIQS